MKLEIKKWGQWCKFWDIGQILDKNQGWFYSDFFNFRKFFPKVLCEKYKNCFKILFEPCFKSLEKYGYIEYSSNLLNEQKLKILNIFCSKSFYQKKKVIIIKNSPLLILFLFQHECGFLLVCCFVFILLFKFANILPP